jgi:NAD-dependent SIR2 family protein deacetylase
VPEGKHAPAAFPRVIVLAGAGISVNAGIPDYRSADTGMYAKSETRNLFNLEYILKHPREFYAFIASKFLPVINGRIRPSLTHAFLRLLQDKGLLARVYTQNVDTLESVAGVADDALVHAHGSFKSARCANPACSMPVADMDAFWRAISVFGANASTSQFPNCRRCQTMVTFVAASSRMRINPLYTACRCVPMWCFLESRCRRGKQVFTLHLRSDGCPY